MKHRLGVDLGSTSLGWCILALDKNGRPSSIIDMGVRIFPDGRDDKSKEPLAVARRGARGIRRNLDRRDLRQKRLMAFMIEHGLMPQDETARKALESLDPYELRAKALDEKIPLHHLGRALFHINQRRGFKSNRKTDKRENDSGNMKNAIKDLALKLGNKTLGAYLYEQHKNNLPVRVSTRMVKNKAEYNFYPGREMYEKEVDEILSAQKKHHLELTGTICEEVMDIIFYQRNLKPPVIGKCRFEPNESRIRKAHPLFQKFRILQDLNHLELVSMMEGDPALDEDDKKQILLALVSTKKKTFGQLRTLLKLPRDCRFNLESERRSELKGDDTGSILSEDKCFGPHWHELSVDQKEQIINLLFNEPDPDELVHKLMMDWDLTREQAENTAAAPLEDGYAALSRKAIEKILPHLEIGLVYSDAVAKAGYHHSDFRTGEIYDRLPYYGEVLPNAVIGGSYEPKDKDTPEKYFGKLNNPTVHIALNQVRKLVNAMIDAYGHPDEIVIELARDLKEPVNDVIADQTKNKKENDRINKKLEELGVKQNYANRMQYKLWEDLAKDPIKRCCPFSGTMIAESDIFSGTFEIEHLLPFSRSFNDGRGNKVLSSRFANREKGNRTPYEAFSSKPQWPDILARIQNLPTSKQWRFKEDAWDIAKGQGEDIIARQLNDTRYMTKITKQYLSAVFDNEKGKSKVWAIPGQMTALLRDKWGLNDLLGEEDGAKDRTDHRHHAIDAAVVACTDRSALQQVSRAAHDLETKKELWDKRRKLVVDMPEPFDGFRHQVAQKLDRLIISYKPDHGGARQAINAPRPYTVAGLHDQTAYGFVKELDQDNCLLVTRSKIEDIQTIKDLLSIVDHGIKWQLLGYLLNNHDAIFLKKTIERIKEIQDDDRLKKKEQKAKIKTIFGSCEEESKEWVMALSEFSEKENVKRVRVYTKRKMDTIISILQPNDKGPRDTRGKPYKYYALGGNYCAEIYCPNKGEKSGQWQCEIISNYHAHKKDFISQWRKDNPTAKLIMRLFSNDMLAIEKDGVTEIVRVFKMSGGKVWLRRHSIAKEEGQIGGTSSNQLQLRNARKIAVDILGRVKDPKAIKQAKAA